MNQSLSDRALAWCLGLCLFLALLPGAFVGLPHGKIVVGATRILAGEIPYRDFWTMYAPGSFCLTAALFAVFGRELAVQGVATCALWAACASTAFLLLRDAGAPRRLALLCAAVLGLARWHTGVELTSYEPAFLLVLLACRAFLSGLLLRTGLLLGATAVFKHDVAAYAVAGTALAALLERRNPLMLLLGSLAVVLPAVLIVAWLAGAEAWRDVVVFPATEFRGVRAEPYPHFLPRAGPLSAWVARPSGLAEARVAALSLAQWIVCLLPQVFFLGGLAAALRGGRPRPALLALGCLPFFWLAAHVQQNTHLTSMAVFSAVLFATAWNSRALRRLALSAAGLVYALGLLAPPGIGAATVARQLPGASTLGVPGTAFIRVPDANRDSLQQVAATVSVLVPEDEPIYVGLARHEATVISSPILYFLCDREPAVRYHELHPGVTDREDVQAEMIERIERRGVRCIVLWEFGWSKERLDAIRDRNRAAVPGAGSDRLDRWIAQTCEPVAAFGEYRILRRRR